jgi:polyribonucleotide 5'-hydroxyl-kinase
MVLGPACSGKSTVVKSLVNMALGTGMGWSPGVVGLDPANVRGSVRSERSLMVIQPPHLVAGSLSLSTPLHPLPSHHPAHSLGSTPTSMPSSSLATDIPTLAWWYGSTEPTTKQAGIWRKVVDDMGQRWKERCANDSIGVSVFPRGAGTDGGCFSKRIGNRD